MAFVGRERELAQLAEAVGRVAEGRRGHVAVTGPAGMGCSRLLDELSQRVLRIPGVLACRGRAFEPTSGVPYQALGDALAMAFEDLSDEAVESVVGIAGHDLASIVPGLSERLDRLGVDRREPALRAPDQLGRRVVESLLGTLERLATDGVLLLVLEDIHLADPATRGFIEALMSVGGSLRVCLIVTYQPDEIHRRHPARALADRLAQDDGIVRIELAPLSDRELERIVEAVAGERPPGNVMTAVLEGSRGNPLVASQLVSAAETLAGIRLSDPFEQLSGARLESLSREAARVVRIAAAAHRPLSRSTLLATHTTEGRPTVKGLEEARRSGLVTVVDDEISIANRSYAEAIEALELPPERQAIHAALAQGLGATPALAAWHWTAAARPLEARAAHLQAAEQAAMVDPGQTMLFHYERALELPEQEAVTASERAAMLAGAARASAAEGQFRRAVALMRRAIEALASRDADAARGARDEARRLSLGELVAEQGRYEWAGGDMEAAIASMERALDIMPPAPSRARAAAQASLAQHLMLGGRFEESSVVAEEARITARVATAAGADARAEIGHATCTLGVDVAYLGDLEQGLALVEQASGIAREAGRLDDLMRAAANRTNILDLDSRREEALAVVQGSLSDAAAGGLGATYGAFLRGNAADILYHLGRWSEAERECRTALEWRTRRPEAAWFQPLLILGLLLTESRADEEASSVVGQALLQLETVPTGQWTGLVMRSAVSLALWTADTDQALSIAEREWPRALHNGEPGIVSEAASTAMEAAAAAADHGRAGSDAGLIARARSLSDRVVAQAEEKVLSSAFGPSMGARQEAELALATARAHAARVRGRVNPGSWSEIARGWAERSMPYREAKARWWQALAILGAASDEDEREEARLEAREPLAEAYRLARALPALPLLREVVDLATRARVPLPAGELPRSSAQPGELVAVGPGAPGVPVAVGPGPSIEVSALAGAQGSDIARAIEERVLASLRKGPADTYGLSPREREVLNILAEGRTDRDIAARLFISQRTVHVHVRRILSKLGVSSRTEAAGVAIRQGLVPQQSGSLPPSSGGRDDVASAT